VFEYLFPAVRGIQATREYYVVMCPLHIIPKLFLFDGSELRPELRAQRVLNKARIPAMCDYIVNNSTEYVFSAITASLDAHVEFIPSSPNLEHYNVGSLRIPMSAKFVINDGQHRRAAIEAALKIRPEMANETISVVFFVDLGLKRSQQMFADLNRYAIRPTRSLNILYDHRDEFAQLAKELVDRVSIFRGLTETSKTTISNRSTKVFTLSGIYQATQDLLEDFEPGPEALNLAVEFWESVAEACKEWGEVRDGSLAAAVFRKNYIHAHTVAIVAIGRAGRGLLAYCPYTWQERIKRLSLINWHRSNRIYWEGRATIGGKVSIARTNIMLITNAIKLHLAVPLSQEEQEVENAMNQARVMVQEVRNATADYQGDN